MAMLTKPPSSSSKERTVSAVRPPINLEKWIEENRERFKPPVSNRYLYDGRDFFVMVIKGPNARNDFHLVDSEEYFYQLKGDIKVRIREGDRIVDHLVREGETFFIPPNVPHAPVRPPDTIGVVVERRRPPGEHEHVIFYCENCGALVEDSKTSISTAPTSSSILARPCSISGMTTRAAPARNVARRSRSRSR